MAHLYDNEPALAAAWDRFEELKAQGFDALTPTEREEWKELTAVFAWEARYSAECCRLSGYFAGY